MSVDIKKKKERGELVVELDHYKYTLQKYAEPLEQVRDSL